MSRITEASKNVGRPIVWVVGDLILDQYTWGAADRVSPESPVLVLDAEFDESRLGGAANVAAIVRALDARVSLIGVVGLDSPAIQLRQCLESMSIDHSAVVVDERRPTTCKHRFMGRASGRAGQQVLRVDHESRAPLSASIERQILDRLATLTTAPDVILVSDYAKGVCTPSVLSTVRQIAVDNDIPLIIDPCRAANIHGYSRSTAITPNRGEAEASSGMAIVDPATAIDAGHFLCRTLDLTFVVVTIDHEGLVVVQRDGRSISIPAEARVVCDVTGAGDVVLGVIGVGLASGMSAETSAAIANYAAGLSVEKVGTATIARDTLIARLQSMQAS